MPSQVCRYVVLGRGGEGKAACHHNSARGTATGHVIDNISRRRREWKGDRPDAGR